MYSSSIEQLRNDLSQAVSNAPEYSGPTMEDLINNMVAKLKNKDSFKNFTDDELYQYAKNSIIIASYKSHSSRMQNLLITDGKPYDSTWSRFTYEEILLMVSDGVDVPKEFVEWATVQADADNIDYEIDDTNASSDTSTFDNMELSTSNSNSLEQQKKLQKFAAKAEVQENLLSVKDAELKFKNNELHSKQRALDTDNKTAMNKIAMLSEEFSLLEEKVQKGEDLTDSELTRYKQLGNLLNLQSHELITKSQNVGQEINSLLDGVSEIESIVHINNSLSESLEREGLSFAGYEGGKKYKFGTINTNKFSLSTTPIYSAQGQTIASSAGLIASNLNIGSELLEFRYNDNNIIADMITRNVNSIQSSSFVKSIPANAKKSTANVQPEDRNPNDLQENTVSPNPVQGSNPEPGPSTSVFAEDESEDQVTDSATVNSANNSDEIEALPVSNSDNPDLDQDPLEITAREYLENSNAKIKELTVDMGEYSDLTKQVEDIKNNTIQDKILYKVKLNSKIEEFEQLLNKIQTSSQIESSDIQKYKQLNSELDTETGSVITSLQDKITVLDSFTNKRNSITEKFPDYNEYGLAAIEAGKQYALQNFTGIEIDPELNSAETEDLLYGKIGESLGRDTIEAGNTLISTTKSANEQTASNNNIVITKFAGEQSSEFTEILSSSTSKISTLKQEFLQFEEIKALEEPKETEKQENPDNFAYNTPGINGSPSQNNIKPGSVITNPKIEFVPETVSPAIAVNRNSSAPVNDNGNNTPEIAAAISQTDSTDTGVEIQTSDTENVKEVELTETVNSTGEETEDPMVTAIKEYISLSAENLIEIENFNSLFDEYKDQVENIQKNASKEETEFQNKFNDKINQYNSLLNKVKNGQDFTEADQEQYEKLKRELDVDYGDFSIPLQNKIGILDSFVSMFYEGIKLSDEFISYGSESIEAGKEYAIQERGKRNPNRFITTKEELYDFLYGKSGESLGRDAIDAGELLVNQTQVVNSNIVSSEDNKSFASKKSIQLTDALNTTTAKVNSLNNQFQTAFAKNERKKADEQQDMPTKSSNSKASTEKSDTASEDDVNEVEKQGKEAEKSANDGKDKDQESVQGKKESEKTLLTNKRSIANNQKEITNLDKETEKNNEELTLLNTEAEECIAIIEEANTQNDESLKDENVEEESSPVNDEPDIPEEQAPSSQPEQIVEDPESEDQNPQPVISQAAPTQTPTVINPQNSITQTNRTMPENPEGEVAGNQIPPVTRGRNSMAATQQPKTVQTSTPEILTQQSFNSAPTAQTSGNNSNNIVNTPAKTNNSTSKTNNQNSVTDNSQKSAKVQNASNRLNEISSRTNSIGQVITSNGQKITTLQSKSDKINKTTKSKYAEQYTVAKKDSKTSEDTVSKTQKTISKVSEMATYFSYTEMTGLVLMMQPWTATVGNIMYQIGRFGQVACYATNAGLSVAEGNWTDAITSLGLAALSYVNTPQLTETATGAIKKAAQNALAKKILTEATVKIVTQASQAAIQASITAGITVAKGKLNNVVEKSMQKDSEDDKNQKRLVKFEREMKDKMNKKVTKIKKRNNVG